MYVKIPATTNNAMPSSMYRGRFRVATRVRKNVPTPSELMTISPQ
jgi:hypothetical protein